MTPIDLIMRHVDFVHSLFRFDAVTKGFGDKKWDVELNEMLDNKVPITTFAKHTVTFEGTDFDVWVSNYPYSYGYQYRPRAGQPPKLSTCLRLHRYVKNQKKKEGFL